MNKDFNLINFSNDQFLSKLLQFEKISNLRKYISTFHCYKSIYCRTCDAVDILTFLIAISGSRFKVQFQCKYQIYTTYITQKADLMQLQYVTI